MKKATQHVSQEAVFNKWLSTEIKNGLVDFKLYPSNIDRASRESFYGELNAMNDAFEAGRFEKITDL